MTSLWKRSLALAYIRVGDVERAKGELAIALSAYRDSLIIVERLAKSVPNDRERQRDLSVAYERIGRVQQLQGDFASALKSFGDGLVIAETLAKAAPRDPNGQRDLALAHSEVGEVQVKQGDLNAALVSYSASVAIMDSVVKSDPGNAHWKTSLRIFIGKLGRLSYEFLLARDFERALRAADDAISHAPEETRIYTNRYRAHALMFLGRLDEARAIYLEYRGKKVPGMVWETVISTGFRRIPPQGSSRQAR